MKQLISILSLLSIFTQNIYAQSDSIAVLVRKISSSTISDGEKKALKTFALDVQNRGQLADELSHDFKTALVLTDSAIFLFNALKDTLNEANNRKFKGYLLGRLGRFPEGKNEIQKAIELFRLKNAEWGVAVSEFDLARVYEFENRIDSALHFCNIATSYWRTKANKDRVFVNQNLLINLLTKSNDIVSAKLIQQESGEILENTTQHWQGILDFYTVSENVFKASNELNLATHYRNLYTELIKDLNSKGIVARSYFREN